MVIMVQIDTVHPIPDISHPSYTSLRTTPIGEVYDGWEMLHVGLGWVTRMYRSIITRYIWYPTSMEVRGYGGPLPDISSNDPQNENKIS